MVYLDRMSRQQYVGNIVARVAAETLRLVRELPYGSHVCMRVGEAVPAPAVDTIGEPLVVRSPGDGWVQQISRRAVIAGAPASSVVQLETRVGGYLVRDTRSRPSGPGHLTRQLRRR